MRALKLLPSLALLLSTLALLILPTPAPAQWGSTPDDPLPICTAPGNQWIGDICRLGSGRYIAAWTDERGALPSAYYQMISDRGEILLQDNGVPILPGSTWWYGIYYLVEDGQGGCIAILQDKRNGADDIYGQRFDSLGNRLWGETGLPLIVWPGSQNVTLKDAKFDSGGFIFLSYDINTSGDENIYMQKVSVSGELVWGPTGIGIDLNPYVDSAEDRLIPDGQGGVLDVWCLHVGDYPNLYAQHFTSSGLAMWGISGILLLNPQGNVIITYPLDLFSDGADGGIYVGNYYGGTYNYCYIFRVNGQTGAVPWYKSWGSVNSNFVDALRHPSDGTIYALRCLNPSPCQFRLHRFHPAGLQLFGPDGIIADNFTSGGSIIASSDGVIAVGRIHANLLIAQRYDSTGQILWIPQGYSLATSPGSLSGTPKLCPDGADGFVGLWEDGRNWPANGEDLYAMYMRADGSLGNVMPPYPYAPIYTQREISVRGDLLQFTLTKPGEIRLELYDLLGRHVRTLTQGFFPAGQHGVTLEGASLPSGVYLIKLTAGAEEQTVKVVIMK